MLSFYIEQLAGSLPFFLKGLWMTVAVSGLSLAAGTLIGFVWGIARAKRVRVLTLLVGAWVDITRGTPFLVQVFIIFFLLPEFGIQLEAFPAAVIALTDFWKPGAPALNPVFDPSGKFMVTGTVGKGTFLLALADRTARELPDSLPVRTVNSLTFSADGRLLAGAGVGGIRIWDLEAGTVRVLEKGMVLWNLAFAPDGSPAFG